MPPEEPRFRPEHRPITRPSIDGFSSRPLQRPVRPQYETEQRTPTPALPQPLTPPTSQTDSPVLTQPTPPALPPPQSRDFSPPAKKPRLRFKLALILFLILIVLAAVGAVGLHLISNKTNPDVIFREALLNELQLNQLQSTTTAGQKISEVSYDFSNNRQPVVYSRYQGGNYQLDGYGSLQDTYFSYTKLPAHLPKPITDVAQNAWVLMRSSGVLPNGVNPMLANLADPRYQEFGVVILGNFSKLTREQIVNFELTNKAYKYQASQVKQSTLSGSKVWVYSVNLNVGFIKVANQSAALDIGLPPDQVQPAIATLDKLKGATSTFYIDASTHRLKEITISQAGGTTITYDHYNNLSLPDEPQTKLTWQAFAPIQKQIDATLND